MLLRNLLIIIASTAIIPQTKGLKQQKFIFSQFWRLEVQDQGITRFDFF